MLRFDQNPTPYTVSIMQHLKQSYIKSRQFASCIQDHQNIVDKIWFSDKARYYMSTDVKKSNYRIWGTKNPSQYLEKPMHWTKNTVSSRVIVPYVCSEFGRGCPCSLTILFETLIYSAENLYQLWLRMGLRLIEINDVWF